MCVTVLPKPDQNYFCSPTLEDENITTNTTRIIFERVLTLVSGGGLSMNGKHHYCGDYIYSGHTISLITAYLVIKECKLEFFVNTVWKCHSFSITQKSILGFVEVQNLSF